ncbi:galactose-binding like protein [Pseudovirgaria hyperparasitica]|uniref:Galactose-binding like protein n=1 Tax=Pseudovirgaria hyperparasitica TaxID=470096 RepID=A0A6A6W4R1_9PEZI|nr:galactose-binding like protein [Pseudovirgaria hyperparasitica]KAF2757024.1 galactose-binding like protein [Pseudovirgaria hyperparasitica]
MPPSARFSRAPPHQQRYTDNDEDLEDDGFEDEDIDEDGDAMEDVEEGNEEEVEVEEDDDEDEDEAHDLPPTSPTQHPPLPAHLREISSLASWTVSSSKPGCSIAQLRSPSTSAFWQSDGPQPHYLNIHFFKRVSIAGVRLFLDFDADESYTPTRIVFLAGTGYNDLVEWAEMRLEQPRGWCSVDMSNVGRYEYLDDSDDADDHSDAADSDDDDDDEDADSDDAFPLSTPSTSPSPPVSRDGSKSPLPREHTSTRTKSTHRRRRRRRRRAPTLRAHLLQVKIMENHQNGKDTHLRGLQIFARDRTRREEPRVRVPNVAVHGGSSSTPVGLTRGGGGGGGVGRMGGSPVKELAMRTKKSVLGGLGDWGDGPDLR